VRTNRIRRIDSKEWPEIILLIKWQTNKSKRSNSSLIDAQLFRKGQWGYDRGQASLEGSVTMETKKNLLWDFLNHFKSTNEKRHI
jgi:hypothetical protein